MLRTLILFSVLTDAVCAKQSPRQQIEAIAAEAHGKVAVACSLPGSSSDCDLDPKSRPPMQSVFKLSLAMTILHQVEQGKFSLNQQVRFGRSDLFVPHAVSALQDEFPKAEVDVPLHKLLQLSISASDNAAADILLRLAGGPGTVQDYMASLGVDGFHLVDGEHALHRDESLQYRNWFEPAGAVRLLRIINDHSPLTPQHTALLLGWMRSSPLTSRLQGDLPKEIIVAHKSGSSGISNGLAAATNDIGLIPLPDGRQLAVAVFITNSTADDATRDSVIARIGRVIYDDAVQGSSR